MRGVSPGQRFLPSLLVEYAMKREYKCYLCNLKTSGIESGPNGHGSTHNSFRADEDLRPTEATPLVRFPESNQPTWRVRSRFAFGVLIGMLILGSLIGIYLLYLQSRADNILPPVETPLLLVSREQWCDLPVCRPALAETNMPARYVVVIQTGTTTCNDVFVCTELLKNMQEKYGELLPYNFMVSSNGMTFEGLGWATPSPMYPGLSAIVVAFIGNFTKEIPSTSQLEEAFNLFDFSTTYGHLNRDFTIIGKSTSPDNVPIYLFDSLQNLTQWDRVLSDDY
ncbi:peptidoglycan-recognition protein SA-like isoform X2 [Epargyreus clarus]|uniref:peptidoglycan-recognition protein SA-like isoform X2 n=1 Tax=Epargyreus clarus TaxID=520877 RepID=UPI003C2F3928